MAGRIEFLTGSADETRKAGAALGRLLGAGDLVCLSGELGAGKTTFVQGLAAGLGVEERYITSPSFALVNEYGGRVAFRHIDLYRLAGESDLDDIGFDEFPGDGAAAVEWPERAGGRLPEGRIEVRIEVLGEDRRRVAILARGGRHESILEELCRTFRC